MNIFVYGIRVKKFLFFFHEYSVCSKCAIYNISELIRLMLLKKTRRKSFELRYLFQHLTMKSRVTCAPIPLFLQPNIFMNVLYKHCFHANEEMKCIEFEQ